ncbi:MAG: ATP-dependent sacrificial sulfur transferase LarE [Deltaproteobacteria bacterium]|nr:ATP-dependent sacrificial sulfur transferase LarE [Deltaproteobacteria bacterium]
MIQNDLHKKKEKLTTILKKLDSLVVAFSGGVDSTFLLAAAYNTLKKTVIAVTAESPIHPEREKHEAIRLAKKIGVRHIIVQSREINQSDFLANPRDRCYVCKKYILEDIIRLASDMNISHIAHGANVDDLNDYRPGFKAAEEMGVLSPLIDAGLTKNDIRALSKDMNLSTWDKPSNACLASRIPYGTPITKEALTMIDQAEAFILNLGLRTCRVRHHGNVARIETAIDDMEMILDKKNRQKIVKKLNKLGYKHVSMDLEGYVQGSMN